MTKGGIKTVAAHSGRPKMKNLEEPGREFTKKNKVGTFWASRVGYLLAMMDENLSKPILAPQTLRNRWVLSQGRPLDPLLVTSWEPIWTQVAHCPSP